MTIEQYLEALAPYAFIDIFQSENTEKWSVTATLRIKAEGGEFTVKSGYGHNSPSEALDSVLHRVRDIVVEARQWPALEAGGE